MHLVYVGLLLFSVTWETLEEKSKMNLILHHLDKIRHQEPITTEIQERENELTPFKANENHQSNKSSSLPANRKILNKDYRASHQGNTRDNVMVPMYPESMGDRGTGGGDDALHNLHEQEEFRAVPSSDVPHMKMPDIELGTDRHKKKEPHNALSTVWAHITSKNEKNHPRALQAQINPVKCKHTHQIRRSTHYLKQLSKKRKIPSDFEGSGSPDLHERGDNDVHDNDFSGDGQPFKGIPGQGGAIGPYLESIASQTEPGQAELANSHTSRLGSNEIPGKDGLDGQTTGTRDRTTQEAGAAGVRLGEGSNDIIGSTNFRELPGKEGNRVDGTSQNAHRGKVEFHYPQVPSKEKKESGPDNTENASYNEIPKNGKGSSRKGTEESNKHGKQRFSNKGKSQGWLTPSRGLDNEISNEVDSHNGPSNEGNVMALGRNDHYVAQRHHSSRSKGMSQRRKSWHYRKPHSNRSPPKRGDSRESSESGSSSESDGD